MKHALAAQFFSLMLLAGLSCQPPADTTSDEDEVTPQSAPVLFELGKIERMNPLLDELIPPGAQIEKLAEGLDWSEGPVWVPSGGYLLFSDIPVNTVFKWTEDGGISVYMKPSGYSEATGRSGEPGSNGLALDPQGRLVLCEHGDRRVSREDAPGEKVTLADRYQGKRFNSPNDLCFRSNGDLYFTDPPYGLEKGVEDPARELDFQGVYRLSPDGEVTLLTSEMTRPNGIAFSPDERFLYVANSDPEKAIWMKFPVKDDGTLGDGDIFYDVTSMVGEKPGLPDGLKVDYQGNLFATGPGGVLIFSEKGQHLGTIDTGQATANCNWGDDGSALYITADSYLLRVKTATRGPGW